MLKLLAFLAVITLSLGRHEEYAGNKLYRVTPSDPRQVEALRDIELDIVGVDFWTNPTKDRDGYVMLSAAEQDQFESILKRKGIEFEIQSNDVKSLLDIEDERLNKTLNSKSTRNAPLEYDQYHRFEAIDAYMEFLALSYPATVSINIGGYSRENRPIRYLRISTDNFASSSKPIIFVDGGCHAREWISPPMVTYMMHKLVENITESDLLQSIDWLLIPLVNPDGYEWTHTNDRLWRKNRSPGAGDCVGVDLNRNYDFMWMFSGSSQNCASDVYAGPAPFSEPETQVVRDLLFQYFDRIKLYISMHSFGSMIIYPWGHDGSNTRNKELLHRVGQNASEAIDAAALPGWASYIVGNAVELLAYAASGASEDYAAIIGVPLTYTFELPGYPELPGTGTGFQLPESAIEQVVTETWEGLIVMARETLLLYQSGDI